MIHGLVVSSPPETEAAELKRILADTVVRIERAGKPVASSSLAPLALGRRVSGGVFLVWKFTAPIEPGVRAVLDPPRAGWAALLHDDVEQLAAFARQAGFQWDETEKMGRKPEAG